MQEITFAAPKAGPKARPAPGREDAGEVAPADRRSSERGREDDFGSVMTAEERTAARKPAAEAGKAETAEVPETGAPPEGNAAPPEAPAVDAEPLLDGTSVAQTPVAIDSEAEPADGEARMIDASVADAGAAETAGPDAVEVTAAPPMTGRQASPNGAVPAATVGAATPAMPAVRSASPIPSVPADDAKAPPQDADAVPTPRMAPEAPTDMTRPADIRAAAPSPPQSAPQPPVAVGFGLGAVVSDRHDWRLTPHVHTPMPAHATVQVQPQAVTGQIAVAIARSAGSRIEVRLDPPELGRVQIQLNPTERGVQVIVMSERPETGDFLRRHGETLARDLTEAGYGDVTMEFSAGGRDKPRERDGADSAARRALATAETQAAAVESAPESPRAAAAGTLDIRL